MTDVLTSNDAAQCANDSEMRQLKERKEQLRESISSLRKEITSINITSPPSSVLSYDSTNRSQSKRSSKTTRRKTLYSYDRDADETMDSIPGKVIHLDEVQQFTKEQQASTKINENLLQQIDEKLLENKQKDQRLSELNQSFAKELMHQNKESLQLKILEINKLKNENIALKKSLASKKVKMQKKDVKILDKSEKINDLKTIINDLKIRMNEMERSSIESDDYLTKQYGEQMMLKNEQIEKLTEKLMENDGKMRESEERISIKSEENEKLIAEIGEMHNQKRQKNKDLKAEIKDLKEQLSANEKVIESLKDNIREKDVHLAITLMKRDGTINEKQAEIVQKEEEIGDMQTMNEEKQQMIEKNEALLAKVQRLNKNQSAVITELKEKSGENEKIIAIKDGEIDNLQRRMQKSLGESTKLAKKNEEESMFKNASISSLEYQINQMNVNMDAVQSENTELTKQINVKNAETKQLAQKVAEMIIKTKDKEKKVKILITKMSQNEDVYKSNIAEIKQLNQKSIKEVDVLHGEINEMNTTMTHLRTEQELALSQVKNENEKLQKVIDGLKSGIKQTELVHKGNLEDVMNEIEAIRTEKDELLIKIGKMQSEINKEFEINEAQKEENRILSSTFMKMDEKITELSQQNAALKKLHNSAIIEHKMQIDEEVKALNMAKSELQSIKAKERERNAEIDCLIEATMKQNLEYQRLSKIVRENKIVSESKNAIIQSIKRKMLKLYANAEELKKKYKEFNNANVRFEDVTNEIQQTHNSFDDAVKVIINEMEQSLGENEALLEQINEPNTPGVVGYDGDDDDETTDLTKVKKNMNRLEFDGIKNMQELNAWMMSLNEKMKILKKRKSFNKEMKKAERESDIVDEKELHELKAQMSELLETFDSI